VTLQLLWEEYGPIHPTEYGYSRRCEPTAAGKAGCRPPCARCARPVSGCSSIRPATRWKSWTTAPANCGPCRSSSPYWARPTNYTYAEPSWTQTLPDWIGSHVRALEFLGGVPRQIVPDNLRAGALRANWYEPPINPTYRDMAAHYGTAILPTRVRNPRDKAKVEVGVMVVE
jgi:transposase